jgi:hypothetical protein
VDAPLHRPDARVPAVPDAALPEPRRGSDRIAAERHPVRFVVTDDLRRSRLTVFFRLILFIPHAIWTAIWQYAVFLVLVFAWFVALIWGRLDGDVHSFMARFVRYQTHLYAYMTLLANPYPSFRGYEGYPIDVEIDPPERQSRWVTFFRLILAIPAYIFASVLITVLQVLAIAAWFVALFIGRTPKGLRDLGAYCLRYNTQTYAYLALLTSRYPTLASGTARASAPEAMPEPSATSPAPLPPEGEGPTPAAPPPPGSGPRP